MALMKRNQLNQIPFVMVDATDFGTVETTLTKSALSANGTFELWMGNHAGSAALSLFTPSKSVSLVRSGLFKQIITAAECSNFDFGWLTVKHASCADQNIPLDFVTYDDSDIYSMTSNMISDLYSDIVAHMADTNSKISNYLKASVATLAIQSNIQSVLMDVDSNVSQIILDSSNLTSRITAPVATKSDIASAVWREKYTDADNCLASTFGSALRLNMSRLSATASQAASKVWSIDPSNVSAANTLGSLIVKNVDDGVPLSSDTMSDIAVEVWKMNPSDISAASTVGSLMVKFQDSAAAATVTASDMSDIASRAAAMVWGSDPSSFSAASTLGSLLVKSLDDGVVVSASSMSDIASRVWSMNPSDISAASTVGSLMVKFQDSAATATVTASDMSDIASRAAVMVWGADASDCSAANSVGSLVVKTLDDGAILTASCISDIASKVWAEHHATHSLASSFGSLISKLATSAAVAAVTATITTSDISNIASAVWGEAYGSHSTATSFGSLMSFIGDMASDAHSAAILGASHASNAYSVALLNQSKVSDIESALDSQFAVISDYLVSVNSDIKSEFDNITVTVSTSQISDIASAVWAQKYTGHSVSSTFGSLMSDIYSNALAGASRALLNRSSISDVDSAISSQYTKLDSVLSNIKSKASNVRSKVIAQDSYLESTLQSKLSDIESAVDLTSNVTRAGAASAVWNYTINEATVGAAPTTAKTKVQAIWNRLFTKLAVTSVLETAYEKGNATVMETWTLGDDDTTATRTP